MEAEKTREQLLREVFVLQQRIAQLEAGDVARRQPHLQLPDGRDIEVTRVLPSDIINEFNNVLTVILGYTELALSHVPPNSATRGFLEQVRTAGKRAKDLVQLIFLFSRHPNRERTHT